MTPSSRPSIHLTRARYITVPRGFERDDSRGTDADKRGGYRLGIGSRGMAATDDPCQNKCHEDLVGVHVAILSILNVLARAGL